VARAYDEAARRLLGETIMVTTPGERRGLMSRLFGRRVAVA
jgi:septum site-determining protein MinD